MWLNWVTGSGVSGCWVIWRGVIRFGCGMIWCGWCGMVRCGFGICGFALIRYVRNITAISIDGIGDFLQSTIG